MTLAKLGKTAPTTGTDQLRRETVYRGAYHRVLTVLLRQEPRQGPAHWSAFLLLFGHRADVNEGEETDCLFCEDGVYPGVYHWYS